MKHTRWLFPFLAAMCFFAATASAKAPDPPAQVVVVVPQGVSVPYSIDAAMARVDEWTQEVNAWMVSQVGKRVDYTIVRWDIPKTMSEISGQLDACGAPETDVMVEIMGWAVQDGIVTINYGGNASIGRVWFVLIGGGGWAGGTYAGGKHDLGYMLLGDWPLEFDLTGQHSPCDPYSSAGSGSFGHEIMHSMDVDSHNPVIFTGYPMSDAQRRDLLNHNKSFLRAP